MESEEQDGARPHKERDQCADRVCRSQEWGNPSPDGVGEDNRSGRHDSEAENELLFACESHEAV
jgi:hypothetical protein